VEWVGETCICWQPACADVSEPYAPVDWAVAVENSGPPRLCNVGQARPSLQRCCDVDFGSQGPMVRHSSAMCNTLPLRVGEVAGQSDIPINVIEPTAAGFALDTAINVNVQVLQHYSIGSSGNP
jgi:hypothetical protein